MREIDDPSDSFHDGYWIDEQLWGHRLHDEQSPWLTFLEFLTVFHGQDGMALDGNQGTGDPLSYKAQRQMRLRNILFNNPHLLDLQQQSLNSEEAWRRWHLSMQRKPTGEDGRSLDVTDLEKKFPDFQDFARVVEYLRRTAVEGLGNKRWTTRFVFPFGGCSLYEDVAEKGRSLQTDRLFFARTGELLYLMLCRSSKAAEVSEKIRALFFAEPNPSERLVAVLQGPTQCAQGERKGAHLPYERRPEFDALAEDWLALLSRRLPGLDVVPHLVTVAALHLWRYLLNVAAEELSLPKPLVLIEMVASSRTVLRTLSADNYIENDTLPWRAVEQMLKKIVESSDWPRLSSGSGWRDRLLDHLGHEFNWPKKKERDGITGTSAEAVLEQMVGDAEKRHNGHVGKIHSTWAREIGLASRRSSRRVRYAPTDRLLKTLVFCRVPERMEMKLFLSDLHERYGFVIGETEGASWITSGLADRADFKRNGRRLEDRLASLGLAERMSDVCAYVQNKSVRLA